MKRTSSSAIRESNRSSVVEMLRRHGAMTRADLAAATGLSRATISSLLTQLSTAGMITEHRPPTEGGTGRPSALVSLDRTAGLAIAVDIGVRHVAVAVGDLSRRVLAERWVPLPHGHSADAGIATVLDCIDQTTAEADARRDQIMGAAISIAAPVPRTERRLAVPGVLPGWNSAALASAVGERWDVPVAVENDANAGALGESTFGVLAGAPSLVYVKLASRVGLGCVLEGSLYRGGGGFAGELGHITVDLDGERCWCGLRGCLELYAGGDGLLRRLDRAGARVEDIADLVRRAHDGDAAVLRAVADGARMLAVGLSSVALLLNPSAIVIGGELAELGELLLGPIRQQLAEIPFGPPTEVVRSTLGDRASMVGALALVLTESRRFGDRSGSVAPSA
ncbi:Sugar kinase of the NBD/HSP70 family, may contain an N-terminal HTH domain [Nocardioides terrae]|uniref:Sugar kinase of the NBD/HSP70 family, may contain an N-terminal HTH domain n=1 Tax=Nocardioides terrae TaxID=574651 RepID=A0A1I1KB07_9ACTN|nr:ROK family transcriptional regulator [Nocardioides terrae]SFC57675.1 Sugar kinase of the NBD/HSP70 family, may contain an N-terminal HTH domain [Nocardioides terrae]